MAGKHVPLNRLRLYKRIEQVRGRLNGLVRQGAAIDSAQVLDLSQKLDLLITRYMRQAGAEGADDPSSLTG